MDRQIQNGDYLSYDDCNAMDDQERGDADIELKTRELCRIDDGTGYVIGWYYAVDGSPLDTPVVSETQPESS